MLGRAVDSKFSFLNFILWQLFDILQCRTKDQPDLKSLDSWFGIANPEQRKVSKLFLKIISAFVATEYTKIEFTSSIPSCLRKSAKEF
jgi:hypothetical protein